MSSYTARKRGRKGGRKGRRRPPRASKKVDRTGKPSVYESRKAAR